MIITRSTSDIPPPPNARTLVARARCQRRAVLSRAAPPAARAMTLLAASRRARAAPLVARAAQQRAPTCRARRRAASAFDVSAGVCGARGAHM